MVSLSAEKLIRTLKDYLPTVIPTNENTAQILKKITSCVRHLRLPSIIDIESLVHDIWLEAWVNKIPVTSVYISHRAFNAIKRQKVEITLAEAMKQEKLHDFDTTEIQEDLERLLNRVKLTFEQLRVIHLVYDSGMTRKEIAGQMGLSENKVTDLLGVAIQKLQAAARGMR